MKFMLAKTAGFCWGVDRAIKGAKGMGRKSGEELLVLGDLVHNADAVKDLERENISVTDSIENARDRILTITAHGRDPKDIAQARTIARRVLDMTCPIVKGQHEAALMLRDEGRKMVLIGKRSNPLHAEVAGTVGVLEKKVVMVGSVADVDRIKYDRNDPIGIVAQTTFDVDEASRIVDEITRRFVNTRYLATLCDDIVLKQEELRTRGGDFDTIIVVGDRNSVNTSLLVAIAQENLKKRTIFVLNETELEATVLQGAEHIFVTAGASTPACSIDGVLRKLRQFSGDEIRE